RFVYWIPSIGDPIKMVHRVESHALDHLPGRPMLYSTWQEFEEHIGTILKGCKKIAMEYSPRNTIPYISKVDAGTMEVVRGYGVEVSSSADLLQHYTNVWSKDQLELHLAAATTLETAVTLAWQWITVCLKQKRSITELALQQFLLKEFSRQ